MTDVNFRAKFDDSDIERALVKLEQSFSSLDKKVSELGKGQSDTFRQLRKSTNDLDRQLQTTVKNIGSVQSKLQLVAKQTITAFVALEVGKLVKGAGQAAIAYEQLFKQFETFLGSADKARKVLVELEKFSTATPFEPDQVNQAARALLAFGFESEKLIPTLSKIGDIAAATGKDFNELALIYGKARTAGVLYTEEINQLTEAGIPIIAELAKQFNVNESEVKKLGETGQIQFANLEAAFESLTSEGGRFFNLMENQSQTTGGRISTLTGNVAGLQKELGDKLLPVTGKVVDGLNDVVTAFRNLISGTNDLEQSTAELTASGLDLINRSGQEVKAAEDLLESYDNLLKQGVDPTKEGKEAFNSITIRAIELFGDSVTSINEETGALQLNRSELVKQIQIRKALQSDTAQELLFRKQQLESAIESGENAEQSLTELFEELGIKTSGQIKGIAEDAEVLSITIGDVSANTGNFFQELAGAAQGGLGTFNRFLDDNKVLTEEQSNLLAAFEPRLRKVLQAESQLANNRTELGRVTAELTASGIDLEALITDTSGAIDEQTKSGKDLGKSLEGLTKQYESLLGQIAGQADGARLSTLFGFDRIEEERKQVIEGIDELVTDLRVSAARLGRELGPEVEGQIRLIYNAANSEFDRQRDELSNELTKGIIDPEAFGGAIASIDFSVIGQAASEEAAKAGQSIGKAAKEGIQEGLDLPFFARLKLQILDALGISKEEAAQVGQDIQSTVSNVLGGLEEITQAQINRQEQVIARIDENIQGLQRQFEIEQDLANRGLANDLDRVSEQLREETLVRQEEERKRLKFEQKAARQRVIQNSLEQGSNLVLAAAKLTAAQAGGGIVGLFSALAGLALIFRIIASAKAKAVEVSAPPQFKHGGPVEKAFSGKVIGPSHARGGKKIEVEGHEFVTRKEIAKPNMGFLEKMNKGDYKGLDLKRIMDMYSSNSVFGIMDQMKGSPLPGIMKSMRQSEAEYVRQQEQIKFEAYESAAMKAAERTAELTAQKLIEYYKTRPVEKPIPSGGTSTEWYEGTTKRVINIFPDKK